ncbi:MAG TPA: PIN domain-containing protein [Anaerolineales bacterium]|nr:PIN domain-containing protein [Anaerolineales bacterium]
MEKIFVDTSALFALVSMEDQAYTTALSSWGEMVYSQSILITNNYVLVECFSLLQHRLGIEAVRDLQLRIVPLLQVDWISEQGHSSIVNDVLTANRRQLSLVDCSCFESMRRMGINKVFSFDDHFREQGFEVIP